MSKMLRKEADVTRDEVVSFIKCDDLHKSSFIKCDDWSLITFIKCDTMRCRRFGMQMCIVS